MLIADSLHYCIADIIECFRFLAVISHYFFDIGFSAIADIAFFDTLISFASGFASPLLSINNNTLLSLAIDFRFAIAFLQPHIQYACWRCFSAGRLNIFIEDNVAAEAGCRFRDGQPQPRHCQPDWG